MRGELSVTPLATRLRELGLGRAEGVLDVDGPAGRGVVVLHGGLVAAASSPRPRRRLGERLIAAGQLDAATLDAVVRSQAVDVRSQAVDVRSQAVDVRSRAVDVRSRAVRAAPRRLGALLVEHGLVPADAVRRAVHGQTVDAVRDLLAWQRGTYRFASTPLVDVDEVAVRITVEELLADAGATPDEGQRG